MRRIGFLQKKGLVLLLFIVFPLIGSFGYNSNLAVRITASTSNIYQETDDFHPQRNYISSIPSDLVSIQSPISTEIFDVNASFEEKLSLINPLKDDTLTGKDIKIAVLDSGINNSLWIRETSIINRSRVVASVSFNDSIGHGTLVGSIISKIAPESNLYSIKVVDESGVATQENVEKGLLLALSLNVSIIHASLGSQDIMAINSSLISSLINNNISLIVSGGNNGPFGSSITSPAIFNEVIAVGMTYNQTYIPSISSVGPRPSGILGPDIVAPGVYIPSYNNSETYQNVSGTSFSAPFVTGSVALLRQAFPKISPLTIKTALLSSATFIEGISPSRQGNGLLNVVEAYNVLEEVNKSPLITFTPREISSDFYYFGQSINGQNQTYNLGIYSSLKCNLTKMDSSTLLPIIAEIPQTDSSNLKIPINVGFNSIKLSLTIPETLSMNEWIGNIIFDFEYNKSFMGNKPLEHLTQREIPVHIENRYPGGRILFYQGYDNDSFIPDGPTGRFSQLHYFFEDIFGMQTIGAIPATLGLSIAGPLQNTASSQGNISPEDLENYDILVLADIEKGLAEEDNKIIHEWVNDGHSLLVLSYPSFTIGQTEYLSNRTAVNLLLEPFDLSIDEDSSNFTMNRFIQAELAPSSPIDDIDGLMFDYNGTSVSVSPGGYAEVLATATNVLNDTDDIPIAGFWHNPDTNGKVVAFGSLDPFRDSNFYSPNLNHNFYLASQIFRWLIRDQEPAMDVNLAGNPSKGTSTKIQISFPDADPTGDFNGTIVEPNGSYTQITFKFKVNAYIGSWKPLKTGTAILWLNLHIEGYVPSNGLFILTVYNPAQQEIFLLFLLSSFIIFAVVYYWISSRRSKPRLTLQEQLAMQYTKPNAHVGTKSMEPGEICTRCRTPRHNDNSHYCYKCGKEL